jgi:hypothetical protein
MNPSDSSISDAGTNALPTESRDNDLSVQSSTFKVQSQKRRFTSSMKLWPTLNIELLNIEPRRRRHIEPLNLEPRTAAPEL